MKKKREREKAIFILWEFQKEKGQKVYLKQ